MQVACGCGARRAAPLRVRRLSGAKFGDDWDRGAVPVSMFQLRWDGGYGPAPGLRARGLCR